MHNIRTTFFWALAAAVPVTLGHTWGEQLRNINDKGEYVGAYGYMRGYRVRGGPDFNEDALAQRMPASNENGKIFITADQLLCHENQREQKQASEKFPRLQTAPSNFVAIRYQENGHITTADTNVGKPEKGGTVYVYGTTDPKTDEKLVDVLQWTQDGKGGDSRGVLLAMNDYDDGRCYLNNETPIAQERKIADPAYMAGTPHSGPTNSVMYCETDVKLPDTIEQGKPYTLYWVWQWPTLPGKNDGLPNGKDEYYSTCIDVDVASPNVAMAAEDTSQLAKFAMLQQDAVSTAVSDWASRTALFSDLPVKREMGPVFSSLPNGGSGGNTPAPTSEAPKPTTTVVYTPAPETTREAPTTTAAAPSPSAAPSCDGYMGIISKWRSKMGMRDLAQFALLESNALDCVQEGAGVMKHKLNPGTFAQVLARGEQNMESFLSVFVGGWLCEIPTLPGLDGVCSTMSKGWSYEGQTGHAEILTSENYSKIGCSFFDGIWGCDLA
jgi:hypothetical protein